MPWYPLRDATCVGFYVLSLSVSENISNLPFIESFGVQGKIIPYIGSKVNLTCKMKHAEAGIFLKAGLAIREGGRFRYIFEDSGHDGLVAHLEITDVSKEDEGVFTCCAFRAGIITTKTLTFKTGLYVRCLSRQEYFFKYVFSNTFAVAHIRYTVKFPK